MNHDEKLMQAVREGEDGTYAKARAWVAYMRHAKHGNEPQRVFNSMMRRHLKWLLSMRVAVKTPQGYLEGRIVKHLRENVNKCLISFEPHLVDYDHIGHMTYTAFVPFRNIKKLIRNKMRTVKIPRFADLNINDTNTGRSSANIKHESNVPKSSSLASTVKRISANELFGSGPIDHDAHTNCSCHPKE